MNKTLLLIAVASILAVSAYAYDLSNKVCDCKGCKHCCTCGTTCNCPVCK